MSHDVSSLRLNLNPSSLSAAFIYLYIYIYMILKALEPLSPHLLNASDQWPYLKQAQHSIICTLSETT